MMIQIPSFVSIINFVTEKQIIYNSFLRGMFISIFFKFGKKHFLYIYNNAIFSFYDYQINMEVG